jgi:hypothetical protein
MMPGPRTRSVFIQFICLNENLPAFHVNILLMLGHSRKRHQLSGKVKQHSAPVIAALILICLEENEGKNDHAFMSSGYASILLTFGSVDGLLLAILTKSF